jgi:hypothetical protein
VQVRPSPWRQAVDLGNMMLVLAVRTDAERVYERALRHFTPAEIAEAFAATRGVASPTQLRTVMKSDGRDLLDEFRRLAPQRRPIGLQRWSVRRVALALGLVVAAVLAIAQTTSMFSPVHDLPVTDSPECGTGDVAIIVAQSVPSATLLPCIATLPAGWELGSVHVERNRTTFSLDSDIGGDHAVEVTLTPPGECDTSGASPVPSDELGADRYERIDRLPPGLRGTRYYTFAGGCVTYRLDLSDEAPSAVLFDVDQALSFQPRAVLADHIQDTTDLELCGAGTTCVDR